MSFPSIYEYEKRGKQAIEDRTTSTLFGHLGTFSSETRQGFLRLAGILADSDDSNLEEIKLWHSLQSKGHVREVDAVMKFDTGVRLVECKVDSPLDIKQLEDEFEFGKSEFLSSPNDKIGLVVITADMVKPHEIVLAEKRIGTVITWTSWIRCAEATERLLQQQSVDDLSKRSLVQLNEFLTSRQLGTPPGFSPNDNWTNYVKLFNHLAKIQDDFEKLYKNVGLKKTAWVTDNYRSYERPFDGFWAYSDREKQGEYGLYFAIGLINGDTHVEFAWYEEKNKGRFSSLIEKAYRWNEKPWSEDAKTKYDYYSRYVPLKSLQGSSFREQEQEIMQFFRKCLEDFPALDSDKSRRARSTRTFKIKSKR